MSREKNNGFFKLQHKTIDSNMFRSLTLSAQVLFIHLSRLSNRLSTPDGEFVQRDWQLVHETGMDKRTIRKAKRELVEDGFIELYRPGSREPTRYKLLSPY